MSEPAYELLAKRLLTKPELRVLCEEGIIPDRLLGGACEDCGGPKSYSAGRRCKRCYELSTRDAYIKAIQENMMSDSVKFQIEKNVKVPVAKTQETPYPFDSMEIGDSFLIPYPEDASEHELAIFWNRAQGSVSQSFRNWRMSSPKEREHLMLTTRSLEDGLRCWIFRKPWAEQSDVVQLRERA